MLTNGVRASHVPHRALRSYGPSAKGAFLRNGLPPHALLSCFRQNALWAYRTLEGRKCNQQPVWDPERQCRPQQWRENPSTPPNQLKPCRGEQTRY